MAESKPAFLHIAGSSLVVEPSVRLLLAPRVADAR
jgi:hypothetical protein